MEELYEVLSIIAKKHNKTLFQVILRWLIQRNVIIIPKSVRKDRMVENLNIFDFKLDMEDMDKIAALDTKESLFFSHRDPKIVKWIGAMKRDL